MSSCCLFFTSIICHNEAEQLKYETIDETHTKKLIIIEPPTIQTTEDIAETTSIEKPTDITIEDSSENLIEESTMESETIIQEESSTEFLETIAEIIIAETEIETIPEETPAPIRQIITELGAQEAFEKGLVHYYYPEYYPERLTEQTLNTEENRNLLLHLLCCEGGGSLDAYIWTCSCILNLCDYYNVDLENIAFNSGIFTIVKNGSREEQRDYILNFNYNMELSQQAIEHVLSGERVSDIKWFRTGNYHHWDCGGPVPVAHVGGHYYSK